MRRRQRGENERQASSSQTNPFHLAAFHFEQPGERISALQGQREAAAESHLVDEGKFIVADQGNALIHLYRV